MSKIELPPLPQPDAYTTQIKEGRVLFEPRISLNVDGMAAIYGAPKLRARDRQIVELCASLAEARVMAIDHGGNEYRREATASQCAAAIRSLLDPAEKETK